MRTSSTHLIQMFRNYCNILHDCGLFYGVAKAGRRLSVVEELEAIVSANLQRAISLRQAVLQKAFLRKLCTLRIYA